MAPRPSAPRIEPIPNAESLPSNLNIFRTLAHHPDLLRRWLVFGSHVLGKSTLPARERELLILRIGWRCRAVYEFGQHTVIGIRDGLTEDEITRLCGDANDPAWSEEDRALVLAVDELYDDQCITDDTWAALATKWSTEQMLDIVFAVGQYQLVSMALNSCGVQIDEGTPGWPEGVNPD